MSYKCGGFDLEFLSKCVLKNPKYPPGYVPGAGIAKLAGGVIIPGIGFVRLNPDCNERLKKAGYVPGAGIAKLVADSRNKQLEKLGFMPLALRAGASLKTLLPTIKKKLFTYRGPQFVKSPLGQAALAGGLGAGTLGGSLLGVDYLNHGPPLRDLAGRRAANPDENNAHWRNGKPMNISGLTPQQREDAYTLFDAMHNNKRTQHLSYPSIRVNPKLQNPQYSPLWNTIQLPTKSSLNEMFHEGAHRTTYGTTFWNPVNNIRFRGPGLRFSQNYLQNESRTARDHFELNQHAPKNRQLTEKEIADFWRNNLTGHASNYKDYNQVWKKFMRNHKPFTQSDMNSSLWSLPQTLPEGFNN